MCKIVCRVKRASIWNDDIQPCDNSYFKPYYSKLDNEYYKVWFIDFYNLDDLLKFIDQYKSIIIDKESEIQFLSDYYITIYDSWVE